MPTILTLGNFDGVHLGHRAILRRARELADAHEGGCRVVVLSFDRHPAAVLRPGSQPPRLLSNRAKTDRLKQAGADEVVLLPAEPRLFGQSPEAFVDGLVQRFAPVALVEGPDFRFGKGRGGDMDTLAKLGRSRGFEAVTVQPVKVTLSDCWQAPCSSSLTRWLVGRGRMRDAGLCLTQPHELTAAVVRGEQQGRTLGIPTANLDPDALAGHIIPADGVYAGHATIVPSHPIRRHRAAISIGIKPTFGRHQLTVEAHLIDYHPDVAENLYGQTLTLTFVHWLRDQYAFPSLDTLKDQLQRDLDKARALTPATPAISSSTSH